MDRGGEVIEVEDRGRHFTTGKCEVKAAAMSYSLFLNGFLMSWSEQKRHIIPVTNRNLYLQLNLIVCPTMIILKGRENVGFLVSKMWDLIILPS